jgi:glycosyltransferase involved in cell wall biosynthesis
MSQIREDRAMDVAMGLGAPQDPIDVSVILPAYNEDGSIEGCYRQVVGVLDREDISFEILFIDDGSTDDTWDQISAISAKDSRVRALRHRRNFGKASALANGFAYARGEIMVTCDADMQYDPNDIVRLVDKVNEGYDVVSAYKVIRRDPLSKRLPSKFFNWFVRSTTGVPLHDFNAGLKAYRHEAADELIRYGYGELHRFFAVIAARKGFRVAEVPVESCYRTNGKSKYGAERYMRGALDFLTVFFLSGYAERPLHMLGAMGLALTAVGSLIIADLAYLSLVLHQGVWGRPLLIVAALFVLTGVQLLVAGLIAEMITNMERTDSGRVKIAQVLRVDRRTAIVLSPGVHVERRHAPREQHGVTAGVAGDPRREVFVERRQTER